MLKLLRQIAQEYEGFLQATTQNSSSLSFEIVSTDAVTSAADYLVEFGMSPDARRLCKAHDDYLRLLFDLVVRGKKERTALGISRHPPGDEQRKTRRVELLGQAAQIAELTRELIKQVNAAEAVKLVLTDGQKEIWDALANRVLSGKELARTLDRPEDSIRQQISELRKSGYKVQNRLGRGYFRPDCPPKEL